MLAEAVANFHVRLCFELCSVQGESTDDCIPGVY